MEEQEAVEDNEKELQRKLADQQRGSGTVVGGAFALIVVVTEGAGRQFGPPKGGVGPYCTPPCWSGGKMAHWASGFTQIGLQTRVIQLLDL